MHVAQSAQRRSNEWMTFRHPMRHALSRRPGHGGRAFHADKGARGFTVRTFDVEKRQWSIFWSPAAPESSMRACSAALTATAASSTANTSTRTPGRGSLRLDARRPGPCRWEQLSRTTAELGDELDRKFCSRRPATACTVADRAPRLDGRRTACGRRVDPGPCRSSLVRSDVPARLPAATNPGVAAVTSTGRRRNREMNHICSRCTARTAAHALAEVMMKMFADVDAFNKTLREKGRGSSLAVFTGFERDRGPPEGGEFLLTEAVLGGQGAHWRVLGRQGRRPRPALRGRRRRGRMPRSGRVRPSRRTPLARAPMESLEASQSNASSGVLGSCGSHACGRFRDLGLEEWSRAFVQALAHWPARASSQPRGWIITTAIRAHSTQARESIRSAPSEPKLYWPDEPRFTTRSCARRSIATDVHVLHPPSRPALCAKTAPHRGFSNAGNRASFSWYPGKMRALVRRDRPRSYACLDEYHAQVGSP